MVKDTLLVMAGLENYASPKSRLTRMLQNGEITKIRRGLYTEGPVPSPFVLASIVYGPSYVSFQSALSFHGLIPEKVFHVTSAVYGKDKNKVYQTPFARFYYYCLPKEVYPYGIARSELEGVPFLLATGEKALCDLLYRNRDIGTMRGLSRWLLEDLRMTEEKLAALDLDFITLIAPLYKKKNLRLLPDVLKRMA
jgi:predicted transcriptional regulator of viral defense system